MHWIKIANQLPTERQKSSTIELFLVWIPKNNIPVSIAIYEEETGFECLSDTTENEITHWMYLISPMP